MNGPEHVHRVEDASGAISEADVRDAATVVRGVRFALLAINRQAWSRDAVLVAGLAMALDDAANAAADLRSRLRSG